MDIRKTPRAVKVLKPDATRSAVARSDPKKLGGPIFFWESPKVDIERAYRQLRSLKKPDATTDQKENFMHPPPFFFDFDFIQ